MTTAELITHLDTGLSMADLEALDLVQLGRLEGLLYHWHSLSEAEIRMRHDALKDEASE